MIHKNKLQKRKDLNIITICSRPALIVKFARCVTSFSGDFSMDVTVNAVIIAV